MLIPKAKCDVGPCNPSTAKAEAGGPRVQGPLNYKANLSQQSNYNKTLKALWSTNYASQAK